ncbi:MAG: hypothetical protein IPL46_34365 [Saprospiraceae bacterium]|nr:hypothetical protein [Saprospiraceae bacterium]
MRFETMIALIGLMSLGCAKDKISDHEMMWNCHSSKMWDIPTTKSELLGVWQWQKTDCSVLSSPIENNKYGTLEILENGSIFLRTNDNSINYEGLWDVVSPTSSQLYEIKVDPEFSPLKGYILICQERLELNLSHSNGCDKYFTKN